MTPALRNIYNPTEVVHMVHEIQATHCQCQCIILTSLSLRQVGAKNKRILPCPAEKGPWFCGRWVWLWLQVCWRRRSSWRWVGPGHMGPKASSWGWDTCSGKSEEEATKKTNVKQTTLHEGHYCEHMWSKGWKQQYQHIQLLGLFPYFTDNGIIAHFIYE